MSVISFLRGQLINHDTPPVTQPPRSKPIRPLSYVALYLKMDLAANPETETEPEV
jgi:hypothetical protein